jgi:hypothetical protein
MLGQITLFIVIFFQMWTSPNLTILSQSLPLLSGQLPKTLPLRFLIQSYASKLHEYINYKINMSVYNIIAT